jgi:hypothetical protein
MQVLRELAKARRRVHVNGIRAGNASISGRVRNAIKGRWQRFFGIAKTRWMTPP